jgi:hypothetical protein
VYVEEVHAGVVITVEDGGLGMRSAALSRAEKAVSSEPLDLTTLSGTRLGLAVVGCLARKHGLTVSFRPSSRGGTGVVVMIPQQLITQVGPGLVPDAPRPVEVPAVGRSAAEPAETAEPAPPPAAVPGTEGDQGGLPKRPRGQTLAASPSTPAPVARPEPSPSDAGSRFSAFRQAGQGSAASPAPEDDRN